jgi:hypothetical protein
MGLLRKIKANFRLRELKRIDSNNFASYDMTEIVESNSEGSVDSPKPDRAEKMPLQPLFENNQASSTLRQVPLSPHQTQPGESSASMPDRSKKVREILSKAFPDVTFDEEIIGEDLLQYPDPEPSICGSGSSDDSDDENSRGFFHGLLIDTSVRGMEPSKAAANDEFMIHSPTDAPVSSPSGSAESNSSLVPPRKHKLAHIFHEELSTLYEGREDEGSLTSMEDIDGEQNVVKMMSPNERCISDRWRTIMNMTIAGQCGHQVLILDEAEI